jgi:hypothetical protein
MEGIEMALVSWRNQVTKVSSDLEPGETVVEAGLLAPRGTTMSLAVGQAAGEVAGQLAGMAGAVGGAIKGGVEGGVEAGLSVAVEGGGARTASCASSVPREQFVLGITTQRFRLYRLNRLTIGLHAKLVFDHDEPLDWIADVKVQHGVAPRFTITFKDGSQARLELPRGQGNPKRMEEAFRTVRAY